jgi:DNA-binding NarL/FixJ family response regulator
VAELMAAHIASDPLTARELEVLRVMAQGQSNKQIANGLSISESTVKSHVRRILEKTQASTRGEAAAIGLRRGLVDLAS